ncbi:hypothetical protein ROZALSC1DRAFT_28521 [Rozella allomycis CSF55]|uniref:protein xylosyltransferase n=1 Tax=Rozella allomycis (strain CSF55) TaxID=988480 RepID=A0A075AQC1_ROZAC|nr:Glycosyl transferase, family 14 domain-containing protein [Rozella allomycis CSF55]RKP19940.1 hypothetical protein ROZALSC1DRAFT_28521 [Rozella allomycis CSF55]|eukprot:EPZ32413.1 Glycosyl transferase, family 14 domain-containing protein [Rozella allomycis CSF55]
MDIEKLLNAGRKLPLSVYEKKLYPRFESCKTDADYKDFFSTLQKVMVTQRPFVLESWCEFLSKVICDHDKYSEDLINFIDHILAALAKKKNVLCEKSVRSLITTCLFPKEHMSDFESILPKVEDLQGISSLNFSANKTYQTRLIEKLDSLDISSLVVEIFDSFCSQTESIELCIKFFAIVYVKLLNNKSKTTFQYLHGLLMILERKQVHRKHIEIFEQIWNDVKPLMHEFKAISSNVLPLIIKIHPAIANDCLEELIEYSITNSQDLFKSLVEAYSSSRKFDEFLLVLMPIANSWDCEFPSFVFSLIGHVISEMNLQMFNLVYKALKTFLPEPSAKRLDFEIHINLMKVFYILICRNRFSNEIESLDEQIVFLLNYKMNERSLYYLKLVAIIIVKRMRRWNLLKKFCKIPGDDIATLELKFLRSVKKDKINKWVKKCGNKRDLILMFLKYPKYFQGIEVPLDDQNLLNNLNHSQVYEVKLFNPQTLNFVISTNPEFIFYFPKEIILEHVEQIENSLESISEDKKWKILSNLLLICPEICKSLRLSKILNSREFSDFWFDVLKSFISFRAHSVPKSDRKQLNLTIRDWIENESIQHLVSIIKLDLQHGIGLEYPSNVNELMKNREIYFLLKLLRGAGNLFSFSQSLDLSILIDEFKCEEFFIPCVCIHLCQRLSLEQNFQFMNILALEKNSPIELFKHFVIRSIYPNEIFKFVFEKAIIQNAKEFLPFVDCFDKVNLNLDPGDFDLNHLLNSNLNVKQLLLFLQHFIHFSEKIESCLKVLFHATLANELCNKDKENIIMLTFRLTKATTNFKSTASLFIELFVSLLPLCFGSDDAASLFRRLMDFVSQLKIFPHKLLLPILDSYLSQVLHFKINSPFLEEAMYHVLKVIPSDDANSLLMTVSAPKKALMKHGSAGNNAPLPRPKEEKQDFAHFVRSFGLICVLCIVLYFTRSTTYTESLYKALPVEPLKFDPDIPALAFLLMAHNKVTLDGLLISLSNIYSTKHLYVFHLDAKIPEEDVEEFMGSLNIVTKAYNDNIIFAPRINVTWATFSIIEAELNMLHAAYSWSTDKSQKEKWQHAILLCGSTIPVHSLRYIEQKFKFFGPDPNIVFDSHGFEKSCKYDEKPNHICKRTFARCANPECTSMIHSYNGGVIYKGPQWVVLSRNFVEFMYTEGNEYFRGWETYFKEKTPIHNFADESFFQTLVMNSRFKDTARIGDMPHNATDKVKFIDYYLYKKWDVKNCKTNPKIYTGDDVRYFGSPCEIGLDDWSDSWLNFMFLRKVVTGKDAGLVSMIAHNIWNVEMGLRY